jgi:hypothetical protein
MGERGYLTKRQKFFHIGRKEMSHVTRPIDFPAATFFPSSLNPKNGRTELLADQKLEKENRRT